MKYMLGTKCTKGAAYCPLVEMVAYLRILDRMAMHRSTPVPNIIFDSLVRQLSESEVKVLLVVVRKTMGWYDKATGDRKERDWIALSQFQEYTGLSNVSIWKAVESLSKRHYVLVTDIQRNVLLESRERHGKKKLFYQLHPTLLKIF